MTDISELVQREEFEMWAEEHCALHWGYLKIRRTEDGYSSDYYYTSLWAAWKAAGAELGKANQRIAELEARTVKIPQRYSIDDSGNLIKSDSGFLCYAGDMRGMLIQSGIKWESE